MKKVVSCTRDKLKKIIQTNPKIAIVYTDKSCPACPGYMKIVNKAMKNNKKIKLVHIELGNNKDSCEKTADGHKITDTPTLLYFEKGKIKRTIIPTGDTKKDVSVIQNLGS